MHGFSNCATNRALCTVFKSANFSCICFSKFFSYKRLLAEHEVLSRQFFTKFGISIDFHFEYSGESDLSPSLLNLFCHFPGGQCQVVVTPVVSFLANPTYGVFYCCNLQKRLCCNSHVSSKDWLYNQMSMTVLSCCSQVTVSELLLFESESCLLHLFPIHFKGHPRS